MLHRLASLSLVMMMVYGNVAAGDSELLLDPPDPIGGFQAVIYDGDGRSIGSNEITSRREKDGSIRLHSQAIVDGQPINLLEAELRPVAAGNKIRPVWQHTSTRMGNGEKTLDLYVDHENRRVRCQTGEEPPEEIRLPDLDRVANVPLNLMLRSLAADQVASVQFQMVICNAWRKIIDVEAQRTGRQPGGATEIKLRFDLGPVLSTILQPFLPRIRFWVRPERPNLWIGSDVPLYPGASRVYLVRSGLDPRPFFEE